MNDPRPDDPARTYGPVLDALPIVAYVASVEGVVTDVSAGWQRFIGATGREMVEHGYQIIVHPADLAAAEANWAAARQAGESYADQLRIRYGDGSYRWVLSRADPVRAADGTISGWFGTVTDVHDLRLAEAALERAVTEARESEERYRVFSEALPGITWTATPDGELDFVGAAYFGTRGRSVQATLGSGWLDTVHPDDREAVHRAWRSSLASGERYDVQFRIRLADGSYRWHLVRALPQRDAGGAIVRWVGVNIDIDDQRRANEARERDLRARLRVDAGLQVLARTGPAMFRSLDYEQTLRNVAEAVTGGFATYCLIDMVGPGGELRRVATAHSDPAMAPVLERAAVARRLHGDHPAARAARDGVALLVADIATDWVARSNMAAEGAQDVSLLDARSMVCAPIAGPQGEVVGVISCVVDRRDPREGYTEDDVRFAEELARRAGMAFDHARAYERERRIAVKLQEASLPKTLPAVDGLQLWAEYRPGSEEATIGGDWYDAFALHDGRIAVTIGDVLGSGLAAAVTMGKLRQAMRAVATVLPEPNAMLDAADETVRAEPEGTYATALAGILDPVAQTFTFTSAGHPGPALRHPDGRIVEHSAPGMLLSFRERGETATVTIRLPHGSALVFFTDGLVEATHDIAEGHRRLHAAMSDPAVMAAANPAQALVEHVLAGHPATDDIAVLIAAIG